MLMASKCDFPPPLRGHVFVSGRNFLETLYSFTLVSSCLYLEMGKTSRKSTCFEMESFDCYKTFM